MTAAENAFRWARIQAVRHMAACENARLRWGETSITEIVVAHASRAVTVVSFTQQAEARSGADWIWWWVGNTGAYGMLVQAKRVTVTKRDWSFDFAYKASGAEHSQHEVLCTSAKILNLLPVYALYLGTGRYRRWERCPDSHRSGRCLSCVKRTVSLMPALLADEMYVTDAPSTYARSVALEEMWAPSPAGAPLIPALAKDLAPDLSDFLKRRQDGTRAIARSMIDRVLRARSDQYSATAPHVEREHHGNHDRLGPVFGDVPDDTGHWGLKYFEHTLNPLRQAPPGYVLEITTGERHEDDLSSNMSANIAGIVVVRVP